MREHYEIISVAAVTAGGKTTVINALLKKLPNATALYFDDYDFEGAVDDFYKWVIDGADYNIWDCSCFATLTDKAKGKSHHCDILRGRSLLHCESLALSVSFSAICRQSRDESDFHLAFCRP